ncbi:MAG: multiheme c-type cytochrome [Candidatus Anammoxibacter sp.]
MKKIMLIGLLACFLSVSSGISKSEAGGEQFVGTAGCKKCHDREVKEWRESKHGKAFERLQLPKSKKEKKKRKRLFSKLNKKLKEKLDPKKDYSNDKKCLPCHTVGYEKKGGFKSIEETPELKNVGCENCHGPGSIYRAIHLDKDDSFTRAEVKEAGQTYGSLDEKVCRKCHDNPDSPMRSEIDEKYKFDWKEFLSLEKTYHKVYPLEGKH